MNVDGVALGMADVGLDDMAAVAASAVAVAAHSRQRRIMTAAVSLGHAISVMNPAI